MREPAKTEHAARQRYTRVIQDSLSCIAKAQWYVGPSPSGGNLALISNPRSVLLRRSDGRPDLLLEASQLFTIVPDTRFPGEYKASTLAYIYSLHLAQAGPDYDSEIIAWHWHPLTTPSRTAPHIHVGAERSDLGDTLSKLHVPSGRVAFEQVVRFLVEDLGVKPERPDDWKRIVEESEDRFRAFRTWS